MTSSTRASPQQYRFEDLTLDVGRRRVWRGGDSLPLTDLTFELLRVLVEAAPNVVSHDEIAEKAWGPRRVVTPENLSQRVMVLRNALGDSVDQPRYIEGVRGRGYRLIPEVQAASTPEVTDRTSGRDSIMAPQSSSLAQRGKRFSAGNLIYAAAGALLLTVGFIVGNLYLWGKGTLDVATASSASRATDRPITFVIRAPQGSTFGLAPAAPSPALSPDGKRLAFVAPFGSDDHVWTQTVGDPDDAQSIIGTNGADYPFWSADGRDIAFVGGGRLKRVAATGDTSPRDIVAIDGPFWGGTWSVDGTIVFAGPEGLYRVPAEGGDAEPLTRVDHTRGEFSHRFPVLLPGDTRFVYLVLSTQDDHNGFYLGSIHDLGVKKPRLTPGDSSAAVGLDSSERLHLFFVRNSALVAQPFDASRSALAGDPLVVASPIGTAPTPRRAALAASGHTLIYRPRFAPSTRLIWKDRRGNVVQQIGEEGGRWRFPSLSPDGTRLAALREDRSDTAGLWLLDLVRDTRERLVLGSWVGEPSGGALMSAWTPDSNQVVYSFAQPNDWRLHRRAVTGADEVLLAGPTPLVKRIRDVTDDLIVFQDDDNDFWVLPLAGNGQPHRLPIEGNHARVSPNGRWLAHDSTEAGITQVFVTAFPVPGERWLISTGGGSDPQWRGDGRELYYVAPDETLMAVSVETAPAFNAGTPEPLFRASLDPTSLAFGPAYSPAPDGQRFLVVELIGGNEPHLVATLNWTSQHKTLD